VRRSGEVVQEKTIQVNDPLIQDGIFFYQSSYGRAGGGAVLRVFDRAGTPLLGPVTVPQEGSVVIPGAGLSLEVMATTENYQGFGPAAQVTLLATGRGGHAHVGEPFVVLQNHPDFDKRRNADQLVQLAGLLPGRWYTGLQVAKDPGVPLIWAGSVLITLGTLMSFFASHRRLWVLLENGEVTVAGVATKHPDQFRGLFEELTQSLRDTTEAQRQSERVCG
jgi:cytochrome c biogenesis protein